MNRNPEEFVNQSMGAGVPPPSIGPDVGTRHVAVLLALFNGAGTIGAQLASIGAQSHADWSLIVSDDGSTDSGPETVRAFASARPGQVAFVDGPKCGFVRNFLHLAQCAGPNVPFAALSDQDDVWLPTKLERALDRLGSVPEGRPGLYAGRTIICDNRLRPLRRSPRFDLPPDFRNALVQSIGGGNTMVLNRAALDLIQDTAAHARRVISHDWWIYQLVSGAGGHVFYDPEPQVLYRQHGGNLIGANDTLAASAVRLAQVLGGRFRRWNSANLDALDTVRHWLTPEARATLRQFRKVREGTPAARLCALRQAGVYRQSRRGNFALAVAAVLNRL